MSRYRTWAIACLACAWLLAVGGAGRASFVALTNPNQFSGNETLLTFAGVQPFEIVTSYRGVGFQQVGAPPGTGLLGAFDPSTPREFGPPEPAIIQTLFGPDGAPARDVQITFPDPVNRVGFELLTNATPVGDITVSLFLGGAFEESFTLPARGAGEYFFYGFETTEQFDQVVLRGPGDDDRRIVMDNLRFEEAPASAVPEPASLTLVGTGVLGLVGFSWKRQREGVRSSPMVPTLT
jgi:hypothetical protein